MTLEFRANASFARCWSLSREGKRFYENKNKNAELKASKVYRRRRRRRPQIAGRLKGKVGEGKQGNENKQYERARITIIGSRADRMNAW